MAEEGRVPYKKNPVHVPYSHSSFIICWIPSFSLTPTWTVFLKFLNRNEQMSHGTGPGLELSRWLDLNSQYAQQWPAGWGILGVELHITGCFWFWKHSTRLYIIHTEDKKLKTVQTIIFSVIPRDIGKLTCCNITDLQTFPVA